MPIPCVDLLVMDKAGGILLLKRKNEPARGEWWFPGGRVHFGESREAAVVRKSMEECQLEAERIRELGTYDLILDLQRQHSISHGITTLYHVRVSDSDQLRLDGQSETFHWLKAEEWKRKRLHPFISSALNAIG